jgi:DNA-binding MarR family transcriptional regulator
MEERPVSARRGAYGLHVLVRQLDRSADRILRAELDLTYSRFLILLALRRIGAVTQRALADELGVTEPTVSRSLAALAERGLLTVDVVAGQGHRRSVTLTAAGRSLVDKCSERLETAFDGLVDAAGVTPGELDGITERLLDTLDGAPPSTRS